MPVPKYTLPKAYEKQTYDPVKQVEGYKKRLELSGIDSEKATDSRNLIEKALNLTPDQNFLFDIFEVLERPQQALFNAIKAQQEGKDVGAALKAGISGNDVVRFKEILHNAGASDSAEKLGADDVAGFIGDVLLDPMDLAIWAAGAAAAPVTGGTSLAGAGALTTALNATDTAGDVARLAKGVTKAADVAGEAAQTAKRLSTTDVLFRGAKSLGKKGLNLADEGITKLARWADKLNADEIAKMAAKGIDVKALNAVKTYKDIKHYFKSIIDVTASLPKGLMDKVRRAIGSKYLSTETLKIRFKDLWGNIEATAKATGRSADEIGTLLMRAIERGYTPLTSLDEIITSKDFLKQALDQRTAGLMDNLFRALPDSVTKKPGAFKFNDVFEKVTLENGVEAWRVKNAGLMEDVQKSLSNLSDAEKAAMKANLVDPDEIIAAPRFLSDNEKKEIADFIANNKDLYERGLHESKYMLRVLDEAFDGVTNFEKATPLGYVRHAATKEQKDLLGRLKETYEPLTGSAFKGNMDTFTGRAYKMSAHEANMVARANIDRIIANGTDLQKEFWSNNRNFKMFEETLQKSMADFIDTAPDFAKHVTMLDEALAKAWLEDPNLIKRFESVEGIPLGYRKIHASDLHSKLNNLSHYLSNPDSVKKAMKNLPVSGDLVIDANILDIVGRFENNSGKKLWVRALDTLNNAFKKWKLLSPGFQLRNLIGNYTNMFLAGVPMDSAVKYFGKADNILAKADDVFQRGTLQGVSSLSKQEQEIYNIYTEFVRDGFHEAASEIWDIPPHLSGKLSEDQRGVLTKVANLNSKLNSAADKRFRLAALMYAQDNPQVYKRLGLANPQAFVRHSLFDPNDLSRTEKEVAKRLMPFYTFTKKNLAFQMKNLFDNPVKYKQLKKTLGALWEAGNIDPNEIEAYKKENMWIPILTYKDGKYVAIKSNLPASDLGEFLENPTRKMLSSLSPAIRAPFELATNQQIYSGLPIEEFKGQQGYNLPFLGRKGEYALSQVGLDVPLEWAYSAGKSVYEGATGSRNAGRTLTGLLGGSIFSEGDVNKARTTRAYQELDQIQQLMRLYKQQGVDVLTLVEAENKNQYLTSVEAAIARLRG